MRTTMPGSAFVLRVLLTQFFFSGGIVNCSFLLLNMHTINECFNHVSALRCAHTVVLLSGPSFPNYLILLNKLPIHYAVPPILMASAVRGDGFACCTQLVELESFVVCPHMYSL